MSKKNNLITEGVLLLVIPAVGYWIAYLYELGFCKYFDIPASLISVSLSQVLNAVASILVVVLFAYSIALAITNSMLFTKLSKFGWRFRFNVIKNIIIFGAAFAYLVISKQTDIMVIAMISLLGLAFIYADFVLPIINFRKDPLKYEDKLKLQTEVDRKFSSQNPDLGDKIIEMFGLRTYSILFLFALFSIATFLIGGLSAVLKDEFIVYTEIKDVEEYSVLKHYDSKFIAVKFDRLSKTFSPNYKIIHINEGNQVFNVEKIGPLSSYKNKTK